MTYHKRKGNSQCRQTKPAIKIAAWNINGLFSKHQNKLQDQLFLDSISNKDVVILTETKCSYSETIHIPNYYTFSLNRTPLKTAKTDSGGIALICKQKLKSGIAILPTTSEDYMWVRLNKSFFNLSKDLYICAIYNPPPGSTYSQRQLCDPLEKIEEDIIKFSKVGDIMMVGDLNARTSSCPDSINGDSDIVFPIYANDNIPTRNSMDKTLDSRGKHLLEICIQSQLCILNGRCLGDTLGNFTCHNYNGSSVVDYSIVSENLYNDIVYFNVEKLNGVLSDHSMITTMIKIQKPIKLNTRNINLHKISRNLIKFTESTKTQYQNNLNNPTTKSKIINLINNCNMDNVDETIKSFNDILIQQLPKQPHRTRKNIKRHKPKIKQNKWYDNTLYNLKKLVIKKGQLMSDYPFDKSIRLSFLCLRKKYRKACKVKARNYKSDLINKLQALEFKNPRQYWKILNELLGNDSEKSDPSTTISPGDWYDYLFNLKTDRIPSRIENDLHTKLKKLEENVIFNELDFSITEKEVTDAITKLKNNKTPGLDDISNEMLKYSNSIARTLMVKIFNKILLSGNYPQVWNQGYVTAIYKSKAIDDPNNYRCLTINSSFGKLFNRILNNRLTSFLVKHDIISPCQIGFQSDKRTSDHLYTLHTVIKKYTKMYKKKIYACFIDFRKAFDKVWHAGLLYKLKQIDISTNFYNLIKCMYTQNEVCMKFHNEITDVFKSTVGVKQGDNLSSTLFNIYINDLTSYFGTNCEPVQIGNKKVHCLMYADDLILLSESASGLQNQLDRISEYCDTWKLEVNIDKTKTMVFENKKSIKIPQFNINAQPLQRVYTYKYLGVIIDYKGDFNECKLDLHSRAQKAYFKLRRLLNIDIIYPQLYLSIFDKTVIPVMTYASEIWGYFNLNTKRYKRNNTPEYLYEENIAEKLHTKLCKIILGVNQKTTNIACRSELGRYPIMINIIANIICYRARLEKENNQSLLKESFNDDTMMHSKGISDWYTCSEEIIKFAGLNIEYLKKYSLKTTRRKCLYNLKSSYNRYFCNLLFNDTRKNSNEGNKLRTFRLFKHNIKYEPYLNLKIKKNIMKKFTQLRLSAHKLQIETARYIKVSPDIRTEQKLLTRICKNCEMNKDETEIHFLLECPKYENIRQRYINEVTSECNNFISLNNEQRFIWLMTNESKNVIIKTINFVDACFNLRNTS